MSIFEPNLRQLLGSKSQQIDKMLQKMAVLPLILYIRTKSQDVRGLREIHW